MIYHRKAKIIYLYLKHLKYNSSSFFFKTLLYILHCLNLHVKTNKKVPSNLIVLYSGERLMTPTVCYLVSDPEFKTI